MSQPLRVLILSGGPYHPYRETTPILRDYLNASGRVEATDTEDLSLLKDLSQWDVLVLHCLRFSGEGTQLEQSQIEGIKRHLEQGKGLVAIHAAALTFDTWPEYRQILGGFWEEGKSQHAPYQPGVAIHIVDRSHPITQEVPDFSLHDELYHTLTMTDHVHLLMTAFWNGRIEPMGWVKEYGPARVHYNALGHGVETYQSRELLQLLLQGIEWAGHRR